MLDMNCRKANLLSQILFALNTFCFRPGLAQKRHAKPVFAVSHVLNEGI